MISSITDARVERRKETHAGLISPGLVQALHHVPFHGSGVAPLSRRVLAGPDMHPDRVLLEAADILPLEEVHVWNVTRGTRFCTYAIEGEAGSGVVCVNGAAAHLARAGDVIIVATFTWMDEPAARQHQPRVVLLRNNRIISQDLPEVPGPLRRQWDTVLGPEGRLRALDCRTQRYEREAFHPSNSLIKGGRQMVPHKHTIIRANVARPFVDVERARSWLRRLVGAIGMKLCKSGGGATILRQDRTGLLRGGPLTQETTMHPLSTNGIAQQTDPIDVSGGLVKRVRLSGGDHVLPQELLGRGAITQGTVGSRGLFMAIHRVPPGMRSSLHLHSNCETAVYVLRGRAFAYVGTDLEEYFEVQAGDFVYIPADAPHVVGNLSPDEVFEYVVCRNAPDEVVVTLREAADLPIGPDGQIRAA